MEVKVICEECGSEAPFEQRGKWKVFKQQEPCKNCGVRNWLTTVVEEGEV